MRRQIKHISRYALAVLGIVFSSSYALAQPTPTVHAQHITVYFCGLGQPDVSFGKTALELAKWQAEPGRSAVPDLGTPGKKWPNYWLRVTTLDREAVCEGTWETNEDFNTVVSQLQAFDVRQIEAEVGGSGVKKASRGCCHPAEFEFEKLTENKYRLRIFADKEK